MQKQLENRWKGNPISVQRGYRIPLDCIGLRGRMQNQMQAKMENARICNTMCEENFCIVSVLKARPCLVRRGDPSRISFEFRV